MPISFFWFRRDLRLTDNIGLLQAHTAGDPVQPVFIFDSNILDELPKDDARVTFIHAQLEKIHQELEHRGSSLLVKKGKPKEVWKELLEEHDAAAIYLNRDYEPYAEERDQAIREMCESREVRFESFKDQVIFSPGEILKDDASGLLKQIVENTSHITLKPQLKYRQTFYKYEKLRKEQCRFN